jgi:hypothetical protein
LILPQQRLFFWDIEFNKKDTNDMMQKKIISRDVIFFENKSYYKSGEKNHNEELL